MNYQERRSLKLSDLEPTPEAAKEYERLQSADRFKGQEVIRLDKLRSSASGKEKEDLTLHISKLQLVHSIFARSLLTSPDWRERHTEFCKCAESELTHKLWKSTIF